MTQNVKLVVFGSRDVTDFGTVADAIHLGLKELGIEICDIEVLIEGDAAGVDKQSGIWAGDWNIPVRAMPADWSNITARGAVVKTGNNGGKYNAVAGFWRNQAMAELGTHFIGIRNSGKSNGTDDMLKRVNKLRKPVHFVTV